MENKAIWVRGNRQSLLIPLEQEVVSGSGTVTEDYYPDADSVVTVNLVGRAKKYNFRPTIDGNLLVITENGEVPAGCYGIEVIVFNLDGTRFRSYWPDQVVVTESNPSVLEQWNEFKQQDVHARAALFFFAKGDKGDPFTFDDLTPEQLSMLGGYKIPGGGIPSTDMAYEVRESLSKADSALQSAYETINAYVVKNETGKYDFLEPQYGNCLRVWNAGKIPVLQLIDSSQLPKISLIAIVMMLPVVKGAPSGFIGTQYKDASSFFYVYVGGIKQEDIVRSGVETVSIPTAASGSPSPETPEPVPDGGEEYYYGEPIGDWDEPKTLFYEEDNSDEFLF